MGEQRAARLKRKVAAPPVSGRKHSGLELRLKWASIKGTQAACRGKGASRRVTSDVSQA